MQTRITIPDHGGTPAAGRRTTPRGLRGSPPGQSTATARSWSISARGREPDALALGGLEALGELFPEWRIWLDRHGWHARRRSDGFVQGYRPGAPAFHVSAASAVDLAAQLCWQRAADEHFPEGCGETWRLASL
jgi:hypothetical protein